MVKKTVEKTAHLRLFQGNITEGCPTIELIIYQGKDEIERRIARLPQNSELYESLQSFLSHEYDLPTRSSPPRHTMPISVQTNPEHNLTNKFNDFYNAFVSKLHCKLIPIADSKYTHKLQCRLHCSTKCHTDCNTVDWVVIKQPAKV